MKRLKRTMGGLLLCGSVLLAPRAWADSAEVQECNAEGEACSTSRVQDGTCKYGSFCWVCEGNKAMTYTCPRCLSAEEVSAAGAPSSAVKPKPTCSDDDDDSGCTVHQLGNERGIGALFLAIGLGAFLLGRRRRRAP